MREERSILIQTCSFVGTEVDKEIAIDDGGKDGRVYNPDDFHLEWDDETYPVPYTRANKWSIIEFTNSSVKFSSAFPDLNELEYAGHKYAVSGLMDSSLYVLGGFTDFLDKAESTTVRRLDINKYKDAADKYKDAADKYKDAGWEHCKSLECLVSNQMKNRVCFFGEYIYIFSPHSVLSFCYIYDTSTQTGFFIDKPPCSGMAVDICVPLEGRGLLIIDLRLGLFYINSPGDKTAWCKPEDYEELPSTTRCNYDLLVSVLKGMLYLCDTSAFPTIELYAYDCLRGRLLYKVELPKICRKLTRRLRQPTTGKYCPKHLVAVSDSKFCLLWNFAERIFCARVEVLPSSNPSPRILDVLFFRAVGETNLQINNCLSVDQSLGQMAKMSTIFNQTRDAGLRQVSKTSEAFEETREESKHVEEDKLTMVSKDMPSSSRHSGNYHLKRPFVKLSLLHKPTKKVDRKKKKVRKISTNPTNSPTLSMATPSGSSSEAFDDPANSLDTRKV